MRASWSLSLACLAACGHEHPAGAARIVGTVVDARTGEPVGAAEVAGPSGARGRSDERGWFVLERVSAPQGGEVRATCADGRAGVTPVRALEASELQIVVRVEATSTSPAASPAPDGH
jgi:hypothetical protein